ncbi:ABC transporter substrate-binding protein [Natronosporangium hydrolyticum]|uniref:Thiamine pyrimidine synthase n=1 Tax=Natronosporangium hydrolyticum TaxID=2811111 RepID=A0A895YJR3_9ACTN|nr:ABC transporter substrate-binding protein [Natronosporangium hydrolyticum]QSB16272.1 ABC transporter substrate-binding protein [Natronosporangium hydrolyticum]
MTVSLLTPPTRDSGRRRRQLSRRGVLGAAGAVAMTPLLAACRGGEADAAHGGDPDEVTYLTAFGESGRDAYARVAQRRGYFAEAGIEVTIEPGAAGDANHQALAGGAAQFAVVDAAGAFIRYANGVDDSFQIVAAIHQQPLIGLVAFADSGIRRPRDLSGRTVGLAAGSIAETLWPTYAELAGLDPGEVETVPTSPQTQVQELVAGQLDAIGLFVVGAPGIEAAGGGREVVSLPFSDYLADLYGAVLVAQRELITDQPDLVRRFTEALLRGLAEAVADPASAGEILHAAQPTQDPVVAAAELSLMHSYVHTGLAPDEPVGFLDPTRVAGGMALLAGIGEIEGDFGAALGTPGRDRDGLVDYLVVPGPEVAE